MKIFEGLSEHEEGAIRHTSLCVKYDEDAVIFLEGERAHALYFILEGAVEIFSSSPEKKIVLNRLGPGNVFGEIGVLLPSHKRTASARTLKPTTLLKIPQDPVEFFQQIEFTQAAVRLMENLIRIMADWLREKSESKSEPTQELLFDIKDYNLRPSSALRVIEENLPKDLFSFFRGNRKVKPGEYLCLEGEESDGFYFIHKGKLEVTKNRPHQSPEVQNRIEAPTIAGEAGFFSGEPRSVNLRAVSEVEYTLFSGKDYEKLKKHDPEKTIRLLRAVAHMLIHLIITLERKQV